MLQVDITYASPEENLACDEALLDLAEDGAGKEVIRFWESPDYFVVVGSSNSVEREVRVDVCRRERIPILRRRSGGGAVVQGPGCLNVALVLRMEGPFATISGTNETVLTRACRALQPLVDRPIRPGGLSDLAVGDLKFSGNAQRRRLRFLLFHGTILYSFDLDRVERYLHHPSKEPDYRGGRPHRRFITNIGIRQAEIRKALAEEWRAGRGGIPPPAERIRDLVEGRYSLREWNERL